MEPEETVQPEVSQTEQEPVEITQVENPKLDKAYLLFAEFHGTLDEQYTQEDRITKLKEMKAELDSVIGYEDEEVKSIKTSLDSKSQELDELSKKFEEANKKMTVQSEELKALRRVAKEYNAAKTGPLANESPAMIEKTPQEIYDDLITAGEHAEASRYANRIRYGR